MSRYGTLNFGYQVMIPDVVCLSVEALVYGMMNQFRSGFRDYTHVRYETVGIEENRTHGGLPAP